MAGNMRIWLLGLMAAPLVVSLPFASAAGGAPGRSNASAWGRPALANPMTITISDSDRNLTLDPTKDYILGCRPGPVRLTSALVVWGGHNVVFQDCDLDITVPDWAAAFKDQTGTLWVHDVHFGGAHLAGGVQLQEPGATVVMRDVLFDRVHGSYTTNHAECLQTWAGPMRLLIDGLVCPTDYQGLFLLPNQSDSGPAPKIFDLRHIDVDDTKGGVALWLGDVTGGLAKMRLNLQAVYVAPNPTKTWRGWWLWPQPPAGTWGGVVAGPSPNGPFVSATRIGAAGVDESGSPAGLSGGQP
jgi:hypothetical protein